MSSGELKRESVKLLHGPSCLRGVSLGLEFRLNGTIRIRVQARFYSYGQTSSHARMDEEKITSFSKLRLKAVKLQYMHFY